MRRGAGLLLAIESFARPAHSGWRPVLQVLLPVLNLFFCAYSERYLSGGGPAALQWFLTVQCVIVIFLATIRFAGTVSEIVRNTRVLPIPPLSLLLFAVADILRDPLALGMIGTSAFGLVIVLHPGVARMLWIALIVVLLAAGIQTATCCILVATSHRSRSTAGIAMVLTGAFLSALLWSITPGAGALPFALPPVLWASSLILPGGPAEVFFSALLLLALPPAIAFTTLRFMERP